MNNPTCFCLCHVDGSDCVHCKYRDAGNCGYSNWLSRNAPRVAKKPTTCRHCLTRSPTPVCRDCQRASSDPSLQWLDALKPGPFIRVGAPLSEVVLVAEPTMLKTWAKRPQR